MKYIYTTHRRKKNETLTGCATAADKADDEEERTHSGENP